MDESTFALLRLFVPGLIGLIVVIPIFITQIGLQPTMDFLKDYAFIIVFPISYVFGSIFYAFDLRSIYQREFIEKINAHIVERLIQLGDKDIQDHSKELKKDKRLIQLFWNLVDSDPSLTKKGKGLFLNGLFWSSWVDVRVFSFWGFWLYALCLITTSNEGYFVCMLVSAFMLTIAEKIFIPKIKHIHERRSDEQLDYIEINLKDKVNKTLKQLVN